MIESMFECFFYGLMTVACTIPLLLFLCGSYKLSRSAKPCACCQECFSQESLMPSSVSRSGGMLPLAEGLPSERSPVLEMRKEPVLAKDFTSQHTHATEKECENAAEKTEVRDPDGLSIVASRATGVSKREMKTKSSSKGLKPLKVTAMTLNPKKLKWGADGGLQRVFLSNCTSQRVAVKVKCSDNTLYRVNPAFSFINPGDALTIDVLRHEGEPKPDKIIFVTTEASGADVQPKEVFKGGAGGASTPSKQMMTVTLPLLPNAK